MESLPPTLAWVERGSTLIRRMNSERVAEDPRIRRLLNRHGSRPVPSSRSSSVTTLEDEEHEDKAPAPASETDNEMEEPSESNQEKEGENGPNRMLFWTSRLHTSVQTAVQHALAAKASDDGYFIMIAPRVYCVAPAYVNIFQRILKGHVAPRHWNAATRLLDQLDSLLSKKFGFGACVFDCGLFDGVKRMHQKPLAYDEFCDGRVASIAYTRGSIPSMHSAFVVASTVAGWLDLSPDNNAILLAPNNEQTSVFGTCCSLYETCTSSFPAHFSYDILDIYQQHIRNAESWPAKLLQRTFSFDQQDKVDGVVPRPQARFVADFCQLLEIRDKEVMQFARSLSEVDEQPKLKGTAVVPAPASIYIHQFVMMNDMHDASSSTSSDDLDASSSSFGSDPQRPYFVIQNEKGVRFSSLVQGVRSVDLRQGPHMYNVGKTVDECNDFTIKMYHLPYGRQGELLLECRLNASLLLHRLEDTPSGFITGEVTLFLSEGDFDFASSKLPKHFALQVQYACESSAFAPDVSNVSGDGLSPSFDAMQTRWSASAEPPVASVQEPKPRKYDGPGLLAFVLKQPNVRTCFGDVLLDKIEVVRKERRGRLEIYLMFHVELQDGEHKVLPYRYLFKYPIHQVIREKLEEMDVDPDFLHENFPSSFGPGNGLTFDEEYARWLQDIFDRELHSDGFTFDGEVNYESIVEGLRVTSTYRAVNQEIQREMDTQRRSSNSHSSRNSMSSRNGPNSALIRQLPTYVYSGAKENSDQATPDCLICRYSFGVGDEIKSLPCFHSYHVDCIDAWLEVNPACPICQFSILEHTDGMHLE